MIRNIFKQLAGDRESPAMEMEPAIPAAGELAPAFSLPSTTPKIALESSTELTLDELKGQPVVLVFYPADNSSVCSNQLALYNEARHLLEEYGAQLVAISTDDLESHLQFSEKLDLNFPLLADADPTGAVADSYGVLNPDDGLCERALFILDDEGRIHWRAVFPRATNPGMDGILQALESMKQAQ